MTMLAHTLKQILEYVPEALPLVKEASVDKEMPLDSRDSTIATALQLKYFEKVAYSPVDVFEIEKVAAAVEAYGVKFEVEQLSEAMIKAASQLEMNRSNSSVESYLLKESSFCGSYGDMTIVDRSLKAKELYKEAKEKGLEPAEEVTLYSGNAYLDKEAAVKSLAVRYHETKDDSFVKIASVIGRKYANSDMTSDLQSFMADTVAQLDKQAGLHFKGHNFHREVFHTKEAAYKSSLMVKVAGKQIPYENLERVGRSKIASYLGSDIAKEMDSGPMNFKNVVETLPLDMQHVLSNLVRNV
jgi:hypothetical protein